MPWTLEQKRAARLRRRLADPVGMRRRPGGSLTRVLRCSSCDGELELVGPRLWCESCEEWADRPGR